VVQSSGSGMVRHRINESNNEAILNIPSAESKLLSPKHALENPDDSSESNS
jgi:hypothetical protein